MNNNHSKLLHLLVWPAIFGGFISSTVCQEPILLKNYTNSEFHCLTNKSSALAWVLPTQGTSNKEKDEKIEWKHPGSLTSPDLEVLTCDLMTSHCAQWSGSHNISNWVIEKSGEVNFGPILDYRWNSLPLYFTTGVNDSEIKIPIGSLKNGEISTFHFSILGQSDAHIYFSESDDYKRSNLYWILIDTYISGKFATLLRKCPGGIVADNIKNCQTDRENKGSWKLNNGQGWVNFSIQLHKYQTTHADHKKKEALTINVLTEQTNILNFTYTSSALDVQYIILNTIKNKRLYWRHHKYDVLKPKKGVTRISGPQLKISKPEYLCLSIIYFSPETVQLKLRQEEQTVHTYQLSAGIQWQVQKIEAQLQASTYNLEFTFSTTQQFYIGAIRICHKIELFMSTLQISQLTTTCEELSTKSLVRYTHFTCENKPDFNCLGDYFDKACTLSCSEMMGSECRGITTCQSRYCSCLSGYTLNLMRWDCAKDCDDCNFGPNCLSKCGHCAFNERCDKKSGLCSGECEENYRKPTCKQKFPILTLAQNDIEVNFDNLKIKIVNSDRSTIANLSDYNLLLQYKALEAHEWRNDSETLHKWMPPLNINIAGLLSGKDYQVRAVFIAKDEHYGHLGYFGHLIPSNNLTTLCNIVDSTKISSLSTMTTIVISWQKQIHDCPVSFYTVQVNDVNSETPDSLPIYISDLQADTQYLVHIYHGDILIYHAAIKTALFNSQNQASNVNVTIIVILIILLIISSTTAIVCWCRTLGKCGKKVKVEEVEMNPPVPSPRC